jgi:two-component system phosphate regulon sensor histidine kinase PhoR
MTRRIWFLLLLMSVCTLALIGLQAYWNYQAYLNTTRTFRRDAQEALTEAAANEINFRQQALLQRYRAWLADTSEIRIRVLHGSDDGTARFSVADIHPFKNEKRAPYQIGFTDFKGNPTRLDSAGRAFFIRRFSAGPVLSDLRQGLTYYYTRSLGDKLLAAYEADTVDRRRLARLYAQALRRRDIATPFQFSFARRQRMKQPEHLVFGTALVDISIGRKPGVTARAWFPDPNAVYLSRMKWVLLGSLGLIGIVVGCFAYTVQTMLSRERLVALKNDFVDNMTHELKTPVATIGVAAEALEQFALGPEATADYLDIIRQQTSRLGALIDLILQSVVTEQGSLVLTRQPLDLADLLAAVLQQSAPWLAQTGGRLLYEPPATPVPVAGDPLHLTNVLATLLDNALKYGFAGSEIRLWCGPEQGTAVVRLSSEGPPIPPRDQSRVFEKFFRVPTGNRHDVPGYGLGLHYARTTAERHGGHLTLQSQGSTTTFTLSLPFAPHVAPAPAAPAGR